MGSGGTENGARGEAVLQRRDPCRPEHQEEAGKGKELRAKGWAGGSSSCGAREAVRVYKKASNEILASGGVLVAGSGFPAALI